MPDFSLSDKNCPMCSAAEAAEYDYCDEYDDPKIVIISESISKTAAHIYFLLPQCVESTKRRVLSLALCYIL